MKKFVLSLCVALAACGYSPVYKTSKEGFSEVYVANVTSYLEKGSVGERRVAQMTAKRLEQMFYGNVNAPYHLYLQVEERRTTLAVLRDATEDRFSLLLRGELELRDHNGKTLLNRVVDARAPYNVEDSPYSTDVGRDRARQSASIVLADEAAFAVNQFLFTQKGVGAGALDE